MESALISILIFLVGVTVVTTGMLLAGTLIGPNRSSSVKEMPYESGMDPVHDTRRRFDVRFHVVAIVFLIFDVELLFLYPWAVASKHPAGIDAVVATHEGFSRGLVFGEVMVFIGLLAAGFVYAWRKGVFQWR